MYLYHHHSYVKFAFVVIRLFICMVTSDLCPVFCYRPRQLYKNISMLFLFPVKDSNLSTGVNATFDASCYG